MAPASPTAVVNRPTAYGSAVTLTRIVIENPALGSGRMVMCVFCARPVAFWPA